MILTREEARRIAVRAQRLDATRPTGLVPLIEHLTFLQLDPTAAVAPSAELIAFTRLGPAFAPGEVSEALERDRLLYEVKAMDDPKQPPFAMIRPVSDLGLHLDRMSRWPDAVPAWAAWLTANDAFRRDVLARLRDQGPTLSKDIPDTAAVPWQSSGWTHNQNVTRMLELLQGRGEVAVAGRVGRQRTWDVADRVYPAGIEVVPEAEAAPLRDARRLGALGIARAALVGEAGEPSEVEGSALAWHVDPEMRDAAAAADFGGRVALLSPFDRLVHDRVRSREVFGFEYLLEMYKPATQRRWGYFALPILYEDRLVGKLDATADRKAGVFRVAAVHEDEPLSPSAHDAVDAAVAELAAWLGLAVAR
ncbi:YcaQ family DNA glycosylase [Leifsonia sp. ZF2019]|uniref:DNA glycosylase AlkZ-like family protein n=1 Tax=Leifsonia sp. ZF2019 TaxID=2781978 RepID=UPI001CBF8F7B|nr:crosslink repair DNA glycosylase YcaQ family protein [Leifsonia sp. ZF2019]UAJ80769.1 YcaQ family DNA glycosylase [Leifsonia sp. ZF2019]